MTQAGYDLCQKCKLAIALTILAAYTFSGESAKAQIQPDATLPNNSSVIPLGPLKIINGGTRAGNNLFHSFSEFSLPTANIAYFNNALDIANIFSRVTGGNPSNINGILAANGSTNLFFLNPNGIILGPNTQLNIGGSFISTTANSIGFGSQGNFNATIPNDPSLLTINPSFFQYDRAATQPANSIEVRGNLFVNSGKSILLVGGNSTPNSQSTGRILIDGTINGFLIAREGRIEIGGLSAPGIIGLERDANNPGLMSLSFPQNVEKIDVSLLNRVALDVRGNNGGAVAISARQLNVKESVIVAGIANNAGFPGAKAGDISLNATEAKLDISILINQVSRQSIGDGGNINIAAQRLNLTGGTQIASATAGRGNTGNVTIKVSENINLDGQRSNGVPSTIGSVAALGSEGNGGNVEITTGTLNVTNGGQIQAATSGRGNAGNATIVASNSINLDGEGKIGASAIGSVVSPGAVGNGGMLSLTAPTLNLTNGAQIQASTLGRGNAGSLRIFASNSVNLDGQGSQGASVIASPVEPGAVGNGGNLEINTDTLNITNGAQIQAATFGRGNAGNVKIAASNTINLDGQTHRGASGIAGSVQPGAVGNGGNLEINTGSLNVTNGAGIDASTFGQGNAGNVRIYTRNSITLDGDSGINSSVTDTGVGNGGEIEVSTGMLNIKNGSGIQVTTFGQGNGGNIAVTARDRITLDGDSGISSSVQKSGVGNGGNIEVSTGTLDVMNGAEINAATFGQGNGGNIAVTTRDRITLDGDSGISSSVQQSGVGNGGNIEVSTGTLDVTNGAAISAGTSGQGDGGNITIAARDRITLDGTSDRGNSRIDSSVQNSGVGNGGNIEVSTGTLDVTNGAQISAATFGQGNGGNIAVTTRDRITLDGTSDRFAAAIGTSVEPGGVGNGGDITIWAPILNITNRAFVRTDNFGTGDAGDIVQISARTLYLDNGSITTQSLSGNGGNIRNIQVQDLLLMRNGSQISTTAGTQQSGGGNGGNIGINAGFVVAIPRENSDITANAFAGNGGNIQIDTQGIFGFSLQRFLTPRSDITASSQLGINGTINILTLGIDPSRGLVPAPLSPGAPNLPQSCQANARQGGSRFIESRRGGLPPNPQEALGFSPLWSDARSALRSSASLRHATLTLSPEALESPSDLTANPAPTAIVEARGWVRGANGTVIFVAQSPTVSSSSASPLLASSSCYGH